MAQLPMIESSAEVEPRTVEEIAYRALSLFAVAIKGEGLEQSIVDRVLRDYGLHAHLTPKESTFATDPSPARMDRVQFSWRYECVWVLLWALGYIENLNGPRQMCDVPRAARIIRERTAADFIAGTKQRSIAEVLDQADLIYRYHWATRSARLKGQPAPAGLNGGVVQERRYALNWLIRYLDQEWDKITTDT